MKTIILFSITFLLSFSSVAENRIFDFSATAKVKSGIKLTEHVYLALDKNCEGYIFQVKAKESPIIVKNDKFTPYEFELDKTQTIRCRNKEAKEMLSFQIDSKTVSVKNPFFES